MSHYCDLEDHLMPKVKIPLIGKYPTWSTLTVLIWESTGTSLCLHIALSLTNLGLHLIIMNINGLLPIHN